MADPLESGWIAEQAFVQACAALPLVSIDYVLVNDQMQLLLGLRKNAPAQGCWFTPGGRIRKSESLGAARQRIWHMELGDPFALASPALMGVWDHFYEDSALDATVSTHYVNLPHLVRCPAALNSDNIAWPLDQHSAWRWWPLQDAAHAQEVHPYVRVYAQGALQALGLEPK